MTQKIIVLDVETRSAAELGTEVHRRLLECSDLMLMIDGEVVLVDYKTGDDMPVDFSRQIDVYRDAMLKKASFYSDPPATRREPRAKDWEQRNKRQRNR